MKKIAKMDQELDTDERNLLSVAYKNVIGTRRAAWRIIHSTVTRKEQKGEEGPALELAKTYRKQVRFVFSYRGKL